MKAWISIEGQHCPKRNQGMPQASRKLGDNWFERKKLRRTQMLMTVREE